MEKTTRQISFCIKSLMEALNIFLAPEDARALSEEFGRWGIEGRVSIWPGYRDRNDETIIMCSIENEKTKLKGQIKLKSQSAGERSSHVEAIKLYDLGI